MPRRLFAELVHLLVREDRFVRGRLMVGGKRAAPSRITAPVLGVVDSHCSIVPPQAVQPFLDAAGSADKSLLEYQSEAGVCLQHVGPLVGKRARSTVAGNSALDRDALARRQARRHGLVGARVKMLAAVVSGGRKKRGQGSSALSYV